MSVGNTNSYVNHAGNGSKVEFTFDFPAISANDIKCRITHTDGSTRNLESTEYSVVLSGTGGSVTVAMPPASGETLRIYRTTPITQDTGFDTGYINNADISNAMDKLTLIAQENRNAMAEVDSRSEEIAENVASATAETISGSMQGYVSSANAASIAASGYMTSASSFKDTAEQAALYAGGYVDLATLQAIIASGYATDASVYSSDASRYKVQAQYYASNASNYMNDARSAIVSAGSGITMSGGYISAKVDGSTVGFDSNGALSCMVSGGGAAYSAGSGIIISGGVVSANVDGSTVGFDTSGRLSCLVSGGSGGGGIDTVSTMGGIMAAINGNVLSVGTDKHFLEETGSQTTSGFFGDNSKKIEFGFTSSGIRMGGYTGGNYDSGNAAAGVNVQFESGSSAPYIGLYASNGNLRNTTDIREGGIQVRVVDTTSGTNETVFTADNNSLGYSAVSSASYLKHTKSSFSVSVPDGGVASGMKIYMNADNGGIGYVNGSNSSGIINRGIEFVSNGGIKLKTAHNSFAMYGNGGVELDGGAVLTHENFPQYYPVSSPIRLSAVDSMTRAIMLNYDSTVMSTTGTGALTLVSTPSDAVVSNFDSGGEFSRVHAGGFCVQGGHYEPIATSEGPAEVVVSLHTPFRDTNYIVNQQPFIYTGDGNKTNGYHLIYSKTTSTFIIRAGYQGSSPDIVHYDGGGDWVAMGFVS